MNMSTLIVIMSGVISASCAEQPDIKQEKDIPSFIFIPEANDKNIGPETLKIDLGTDGELGETCWLHANGEIVFSGIIKDDKTIVYDRVPDYSRCTH